MHKITRVSRKLKRTKERIMAKKVTKYVYFFGNGKAEGTSSMKDLLGGKGANLAEMTNIGLPVPPGFTISTEACDYFSKHNGEYPEGMREEVLLNLKQLDTTMGAKLGDSTNPLLVSVRSGAAQSMPGMMDTVLNLGLNPDSVEALSKKTGNERFAWDSYRRFIQMFGDVVMGVPHDKFEEAIQDVKDEEGLVYDYELTTENLQNLVKRYKRIYKRTTGEEFPVDPYDQLFKAINAVFRKSHQIQTDERYPRTSGNSSQRPVHGFRKHGRDFWNRCRLHT